MSVPDPKRTSIGCRPLVGSLVPVLSERRRNVRINRRDFFFFPSPFSQKKFSKKTFPARVIIPKRGEANG